MGNPGLSCVVCGMSRGSTSLVRSPGAATTELLAGIMPRQGAKGSIRDSNDAGNIAFHQ